MLISAMTNSKFLKKEDVMERPVLVTIDRISQQNVAMDDQPQEMKYCLHFRELEKPLVLNQTNIALCADACKSEETNDWPGKQVVLFNDAAIMFQGKRTGGIRIRAAKNGQPKTAQPPLMQPSVSEVNRKLQETADDLDLQRHGADLEF